MTDNYPCDVNTRLIEDLSEKLKTTNIFKWIEKTSTSLSKYGNTGKWIDIRAKRLYTKVSIAKFIYYKKLPEFETSPYLASLQIIDNKAIIYCSSLLSESYQRFWIAHEIAHLMWRQSDNLKLPLSDFEVRFGRDSTIEWLCHLFASALLIPQYLLDELVTPKQENLLFEYKNFANKPTDISSIPLLSKQFRVSEHIFVRRVFYNLNKLDVAVFSIQCQKTNQKTIKKKIRWAASPNYHLTTNRNLARKVIPDDMFSKKSGYSGLIDSRWEELVKDLYSKRNSKPLYTISPTKDVKIEGSFYFYSEKGKDKILVSVQINKELVKYIKSV